MSTIFDGMNLYASKYEKKNTQKFDADTISMIKSAKVVASEYGTSVCLALKSGGCYYVPTSRDTTCAIGDTVDLTKASMITLGRPGSDDIKRIEF